MLLQAVPGGTVPGGDYGVGTDRRESQPCEMSLGGDYF